MAAKKTARKQPPAKAGEDKKRLSAESIRLRLVVFLCGAVLMSLEIVGSRVLSPSFGTGVFVWGSLIGIFLGALSLGYYLGGMTADRWPKFDVLACLIIAGGLLILLIPPFGGRVCHSMVKAQMGVRMGPLLASLILFFVPSVLMGTVSPYAIRLKAENVATVGNVAGVLYALSTLGSIAGTLLTTFLLIGVIGTKAILYSLGFVLLIVGIGGSLCTRLIEGGALAKRAVAGALVFVVAGLLLLIPVPPVVALMTNEKVIDGAESAYHRIIVTEMTKEVSGETETTKLLRFDKYIESSIYCRPPYESACTYTDLLHLPLIFDPKPRKVLFIGGGGGVAPRTYYEHYYQRSPDPDPEFEIEIVEIDPCVLEIAQKHFRLKLSDRLKAHVQDGRIFLSNTDRKYDIIVLDAFTTGGRPPWHLMTREFLELVRGHLTDNGIAISNIISARRGKASGIYLSELKTYKSVFTEGRGQVYVFPKVVSGYERDRSRAQNVMIIGTMATKRLSEREIERAALRLVDHKVVRVKDFLWHAKNYQPAENTLDLSGVPLLTDDFAPVDLMVSDH